MSATVKAEDNGYDDLYGDLYGDEDEPAPAAAATSGTTAATSDSTAAASAPATSSTPASQPIPSFDQKPALQAPQQQTTQPPPMHFDPNYAARAHERPLNVRPSDMPDEGKMFIGGLNWDTTDESLRTYFEQFGKITHSTIMRDAESGRSRGFAFLTFEDPASVTTVLNKDHFLDGKTIDPKRAVPRSEASKSDKLFVRAIPQTATPESFRAFWRQFGTVTDATLMMDKESGRHRGFGFVNYEAGESVEKVLNSGPHFMDGQLLEVKRAQAKGEARRPDYGVNTNFGHGGAGGFTGPMQGGVAPAINPNGPAGGAAPFDPVAMSKFFTQMGWGAWNPMMMGGMMGMPGMGMPGMGGMGGGMGGMPGFGGMGGMMGGMQGMGGMGGGFGGAQGGAGGAQGGAGGAEGGDAGAGAQSPWTGPMAQQPMRGGRGGGRGGRGGHFNPPTGPAAMRGPGAGNASPEGGASGSATGGAGPQRTRGGGAGYHGSPLEAHRFALS